MGTGKNVQTLLASLPKGKAGYEHVVDNLPDEGGLVELHLLLFFSLAQQHGVVVVVVGEGAGHGINNYT